MSIFRNTKGDGRGLDLRLTLLFGVIALLIGLWSIPASLWEWDEILFARGLHNFDIPDHSPHPPGFPLYIFAGRAALLLGVDDKTALCLVGLVFAFILGAAAFRFFHEIFEDRRTASISTALLLAIPPVMIYLGAPRSDVPGMSAGFLVLALALRGRTSSRALAAAGLALGLGFGVRVTILFAAAPVLAGVSSIYLARRKWKPVLTAAALAVFGVLLCYVPLVVITGPNLYLAAMRGHTRYTSTVDTFLAPGLNSDWGYRLGRYFIDSWGTPYAAGFIGLFAVAGIAVLIARGRVRALGWMALAFLPIMTFSVLYMTPLAAPLYAVPFLPFFAGLAGAGLVPPRRETAAAGRPSFATLAGAIIAAGAVVFSVVWTSPVLTMRRRQAGPSWQAVTRILESRDPAKTVLHFDGNFRPFIPYIFADYRTIRFRPDAPGDFNLLDPEAAVTSPGIVLTLDPAAGTGGDRFHWDNAAGEARLKKLSLGRYFDVFVKDLDPKRTVVLESGWYGRERDEGSSWRWMGRRSETAVLALFGKMILRLNAAINPASLKPGEAAEVVVRLDGREVDRFRTTGGEFVRTITVATPRPDPWKRLTIETDRAVVPAELKLNDDTRELGLQVFDFSWTPAPDTGRIIYDLESFVAGGWYLAEAAWRWTGAEAFLTLPALGTDGRLDLMLEVPEGPEGKRAHVTFEVNGRVIDSFDPPPGEFSRSFAIPAAIHGGKAATLRLTADRLVTEEVRNLGICVYYASWAPKSGPDSSF